MHVYWWKPLICGVLIEHHLKYNYDIRTMQYKIPFCLFLSLKNARAMFNIICCIHMIAMMMIAYIHESCWVQQRLCCKKWVSVPLTSLLIHFTTTTIPNSLLFPTYHFRHHPPTYRQKSSHNVMLWWYDILACLPALLVPHFSQYSWLAQKAAEYRHTTLLQQGLLILIIIASIVSSTRRMMMIVLPIISSE